jgi:hypothetical protein
MTTRARAALADCETALQDFNASAGTVFWRTRWLGLITLLRAVGHVLRKTDGGEHATTEMRQRIDAAWKKLHNPSTKQDFPIFHEFIEAERNSLIKQYEFGASVYLTGRMLGMLGQRTVPRFEMLDGRYKGRDPRELCTEAIEFWRGYLDGIDSGAAA